MVSRTLTWLHNNPEYRETQLQVELKMAKSTPPCELVAVEDILSITMMGMVRESGRLASETDYDSSADPTSSLRFLTLLAKTIHVMSG